MKVIEHIYHEIKKFNLSTRDLFGMPADIVWPNWVDLPEEKRREHVIAMPQMIQNGDVMDAAARHSFFVAHAMSNGWRQAFFFSYFRKTNPFLVPWSDLDERIKICHEMKDCITRVMLVNYRSTGRLITLDT